MARNLRKPPELEIGLRVLVQNKKGVFCIPAKVIAIRPESHDRTAVVEYTDGSTQIRNRRFFIVDKSQPQVNDIVANIETDQNHYLRLERSSSEGNSEKDRQFEEDGVCDFEVIQVVMSKRVKSCMKGANCMKTRRKRVSFVDSAGAQLQA